VSADDTILADPTDLTGRVAVVTGASSGLGHRFARVLAHRGATVLAAARRLDRLEELAGGTDRVVPVRCDVTVEEDRAALLARAADLGGVDVLVNNAGWAEALPAAEHTLESFRRTLEIDLTAPFALSVAAAVQMRAAGHGSIVNIASILGLVGSAPVPQSAYGAAKGGMVTLTRHLACEWARDGIRVNAIAPGWFPTELTEPMFADDTAAAWIRRNTPVGRIGRPDELDGVLLLLAGPASTYITGQVIAVDGGWTAR
jgi:NAD(P)-dependent dehydrogenase (short-subunit alcohol dehydrogenase family)